VLARKIAQAPVALANGAHSSAVITRYEENQCPLRRQPSQEQGQRQSRDTSRTFSEEIWGEVDHKFNYPHPIESFACGEQIKVLARVASSYTRLELRTSLLVQQEDQPQRISRRPSRRRQRSGPRHLVGQF